MPKIEVSKPFKHADLWEVHGREYGVGEHDVSDRCAEVAVMNGWGKVVSEKKEPAPVRPTVSQTGADKPPASSEPVKASQSSKPKRFGKRGSKA